MRRKLTTFLLLLMVALMAAPADARRRRWGRARWGKKVKKKRRHRGAHRRTKKRVVVLGFSGPRAGQARAAFVGAIRRSARVLSAGKFSQAGGSGEPAGITAGCAKLRCDAVVSGAVAKRGRRYTLTVSVFDGGTGDRIGRRAAGVRGKRRIRKAGFAVGRKCSRLIAKGRRPARDAVASAPPPPEAEQPAAAPEKTAVAQAPSEKDDDLFPSQGTREKGAKDGEDDSDSDDDTTVSKRASSTRTAGLFSIGASVGMAKRSFSLEPKGTQGERTYDGGWYPEFAVAADVYPLALATRGFLKNLGVGANFSRHLTISTQGGEGSQSNGEDVADTGSQQLLLDLRLRVDFSDKATLLGFTGFGMRDFTLGENDVLTSVSYKFVRIGISGVLPLGTPLLALHVGMEARPVLTLGQEVADHFGKREKAFGWTVMGGVGGSLSFGLLYFASFEYQSYMTGFEGLEAAEITPEKGSVDMGPASEGNDQYFRVWLGLGYAL
jgi:opacity protein-like surface antigen